MSETRDLIERQAAIDALGRRPDAGRFSSNYELGARNQYDNDRLALETLPPAEPKVEDVVDLDFKVKELKKAIDHVAGLLTSAQPEITHCAECIHWKHSDVSKSYCDVFDWMSKAEDFCSFAERKEHE